MKLLIAASISTRNLIGESERAIDDMDRWLERARQQGAELALFPELNLSGYIPASVAREIAATVPGPSTEKVIRLAERYDMTIAFGLIEREGDEFHCTHVLVNQAGIIGKQSKIHVPAHEQPFWSPGHSIDVFDIGKAKVGITVCRDAFFDEMTRTLYFKGAEILLMPFGYYNVPRSQYLAGTIHGMSLIKSAWTNGFYELVCNSAEERPANRFDPQDRKFPGWAGIIDPWGKVLKFVDRNGHDEAMVVQELDPAQLIDRRSHPNFLAKELRPELYCFA
jgi:N-carbamoylputrescine amidase